MTGIRTAEAILKVQQVLQHLLYVAYIFRAELKTNSADCSYKALGALTVESAYLAFLKTFELPVYSEAALY